MCLQDIEIARSLVVEYITLSGGQTNTYDPDETIFSIIIGAPQSGSTELEIEVGNTWFQLAQRSSEAPQLQIFTRDTGPIFRNRWRISSNSQPGLVIVTRLPWEPRPLSACNLPKPSNQK